MNKVFTNGYALLVGSGGDLPNTIDDANGIGAILKDPDRCGYPEANVMILTGENARRNNILNSLDKLKNVTDPEATVLIFYSGHGYQVTTSIGEFYYLMPFGYNKNNLPETAISGREFIQMLQNIPAQKMLLLLDCCHAGGISDFGLTSTQVTKSPMPPEALSFLNQGNGKVVIASSTQDEVSFAGKPYSAFTFALIESFCGIGTAKQDGYVRVTDLALRAREIVPQRTHNRQHPILHFEHADNFVIAYYAGGEPKSKGLPFRSELEIEPDPGAWTNIDQSGQVVSGPQTIISGTVHGSIFSGIFQSEVKVENFQSSNRPDDQTKSI